ncbi:lysylphosphatidylglycerol synthase transmembrane domain-containing protein [Chroococcidiopsis sp. CCMEE 29]|uniref:lysylphosphatidylglycerol synthase transmembrane domain-containing protein n=1 Tax=Chroococcidiopsis sp. CCMEE 29 TaxID=155894 RepID=UPI002020F748|nr:lysylphosphatidylglycerol synthase transmembrane domain-containing protein [Chroococcidiopsis sp. CCMEE 29]
MLRFRSKQLWVGLSTLLLVGIFFSTVELSGVLIAASKVGWLGLLQIFFLVAVTQLIRAVRFFELLSLRINIQYSLVLQITCIYQFLNHILPIRSGELSLPILLKRYSNCTYSSSVAFLVLTRLYDVLALAIIVFLAAAVLIYRGVIEPFWLFVFISALLLAMLLISLLILCVRTRNPRQRQNAINNLAIAKVPLFLKQLFFNFKTFGSNLYHEFLIYKGILLHLRLLSYSVSIWLALFLLFWRVLQLVGFYVSFSEVVLGSSLANLTQLLPINTLGNIGTLEAGWVLGFTMLGFDSYKTLTAGIVMHVIVIVAAGTYGIVSWIVLSLKANHR